MDGPIFFFGSSFFAAPPYYSLHHAAILKVCEFTIFYFGKSHRSARGRALAPFPSFLLPILAKFRSPEGAPRNLARIGRRKEGKRLGAGNAAASMLCSLCVSKLSKLLRFPPL